MQVQTAMSGNWKLHVQTGLAVERNLGLGDRSLNLHLQMRSCWNGKYLVAGCHLSAVVVGTFKLCRQDGVSANGGIRLQSVTNYLVLLFDRQCLGAYSVVQVHLKQYSIPLQKYQTSWTSAAQCKCYLDVSLHSPR